MHGTTNVGIRCEEGIALGNDCRTTYGFMSGNTKMHEILSDGEIKIFQISSKPHIFCTLMGDVEEWHKMYGYILKDKPRSVKDSLDKAKEYLQMIRRSGKEIGTIVAGYSQKEGFKMGSRFIHGGRINEDNSQAMIIGSGAYHIKSLLNELVKDDAIVTKKDAVVICLRMLMNGCFHDYFTGCKFRVTFLHDGGCTSETYQLLNVHTLLYDSTEERSTILFIYSTSFGPIFGGESTFSLVRDLLGDWWSKNRAAILQSNTIAKKASFYVNRIMFSKVEAATKVYEELRAKNADPIYPQALAHIQRYLIDCVRANNDHVYVGRSSKELLEGLCQLEDAETLKY